MTDYQGIDEQQLRQQYERDCMYMVDAPSFETWKKHRKHYEEWTKAKK